jgi:hypothetical protein
MEIAHVDCLLGLRVSIRGILQMAAVDASFLERCRCRRTFRTEIGGFGYMDESFEMTNKTDIWECESG